jgi:hypothetical protein
MSVIVWSRISLVDKPDAISVSSTSGRSLVFEAR